MNTSLERNPMPAWIRSTVSARVTTFSPTSPFPSVSYQITRTRVGLPPSVIVGIRSAATSMPALIWAPTSALMPDTGMNAPSRISLSWARAIIGPVRATSTPSTAVTILMRMENTSARNGLRRYGGEIRAPAARVKPRHAAALLRPAEPPGREWRVRSRPDRSAPIRPRLRLLQLRGQPEQHRLVPECADELHAERQTGAGPREGNRHRRI